MRIPSNIPLGIAITIFGAAAACSSDPGLSAPPDPMPDAARADAAPDATRCHENDRMAGKCAALSDYGLFTGNGSTQEPVSGVYRYDVIAPLFADDAAKYRFIQLPPGAKARYADGDVWELPVGTIVVKTFSYPRDARDPAQGERLIETRLLIQAPTEIVPITYVWNDAQTEAVREVAGQDVDVEWVDGTGGTRLTEYRIPNTNDCRRCHGVHDVEWLGIRTRQLDRSSDAFAGENQIDALAARGFFESPPASGPRDHLVDPQDATAPIDLRARSYLDANCGHCHNKNAAADWSGLELDWGDRSPGVLGVCKAPSSAGDTGGHRFDIVPGKPEESVLLHRMQLTSSAYRMPEGSRTPDAVGIAVVADWIKALPPDDCRTQAF